MKTLNVIFMAALLAGSSVVALPSLAPVNFMHSASAAITTTRRWLEYPPSCRSADHGSFEVTDMAWLIGNLTIDTIDMTVGVVSEATVFFELATARICVFNAQSNVNTTTSPYEAALAANATLHQCCKGPSPAW